MTHQGKAVEQSPEAELTLAELNEGRSYMYQWFSQQYQAELTEDQWQALAGGELSPFFELLAENGLAVEVQDYTDAVAQLHKEFGAKARIVLASDFAHAFLLSGRESAMPYASAYDPDAEGLLYGAMAEVMKQFLAGAGLGLAKDFKEPEDHLAIYLAILSHMAGSATGGDIPVMLMEQNRFIDEALVPWLPAFVEKCQTLGLQTEVYPALARLLAAFLAQDQQFLAANATVTAE